VTGAPLGWLGIVRLGLVQTALGAIVVLTTSTLNRVMVVEMALPAMLPGALVALHYAVQIVRPRLGHGSDVGGRRTPWIIGGMMVLAAGGTLAAAGTAWMASNTAAGIAVAVVAFVMIGLGVGAAGTTLLVLLAKRVEPGRRAAAATIVWFMMIAGFALTAGLAGRFLDPFTPGRLVLVTAVVAIAAVLLTLVAVAGVEGPAVSARPEPAQARPTFRQALTEVWAEPTARRFRSSSASRCWRTAPRPDPGAVRRHRLGLTPGETAQLSGCSMPAC
jgi:BCD family chlorophyll transporter-like MFS transporter